MGTAENTDGTKTETFTVDLSNKTLHVQRLFPRPLEL